MSEWSEVASRDEVVPDVASNRRIPHARLARPVQHPEICGSHIGPSRRPWSGAGPCVVLIAASRGRFLAVFNTVDRHVVLEVDLDHDRADSQNGRITIPSFPRLDPK